MFKEKQIESNVNVRCVQPGSTTTRQACGHHWRGYRKQKVGSGQLRKFDHGAITCANFRSTFWVIANGNFSVLFKATKT